MTLQTFGQYNDGYHMGDSWGWGFMIMLGMIITIAVVLLVVKAMQHPDSSKNKSDHALETVKRRYASGEINKAEYDQLRKDLK